MTLYDMSAYDIGHTVSMWFFNKHGQLTIAKSNSSISMNFQK